MKFLCLECDQPMKLYETAPPDRGSIALKYECPECMHQIAMLTNPYETQLVGSLGVKIGPDGQDAEGCPFAAMVQEDGAKKDSGVVWTDDARARLDKMPAFARPMATEGIERWARENGFDTVDGAVLDQAKDFFGM